MIQLLLAYVYGLLLKVFTFLGSSNRTSMVLWFARCVCAIMCNLLKLIGLLNVYKLPKTLIV